LKFILAWLALLWLLLRPAIAHADDPRLTYWTYETDHFRITYAEPLDTVAKRVALLSEGIHARLSREMHFEPAEKTEILLTDNTDSANGVATPVPYNSIRLFVTAPGDFSTLGDYDDWLLGLITHEYTHILHTGNISGAAAIANRIIGRTLAPNSAQPRWIIEGLAVVAESDYSSAGRIRSNVFDMVLRADVMEGNFARLDQISGNPYRYPGGNLFYLYGSRFLRWIVDIYGRDTFGAVSADYSASTAPFGVNRAIRRVTGRTYEDLYDAWFEHLKIRYGEQVAEVDRRGRREGARITFHGRQSFYPRFVPKGFVTNPGEDEIIYFRADQNERSGLYRFRLGDVSSGEERNEVLVARTNNDSPHGFTDTGDLVFQGVDSWRNIYNRNDLFLLPAGERSTVGTERERVRLSEGLRASDPDVSMDGRHIVFTVNSKGTTYLSIADLSPEHLMGPRKTLAPSARFEQAYTPRFSPDGRSVAYSAWTTGGFRDIRVVDVASGKVTRLTHDRALDMQPTWSSDGQRLYWSSDRSGIFNIYVYSFETKTLKQVTNVASGAFAPAVSDDEKKLVYVGYTHEGYDLFSMKLDSARYLDAVEAPFERPDPIAEPIETRVEKKPYNPLPTFGPHTYTAELGNGYYDTTAFTFRTSGSDLVGRHSLSFSLTIEPSAPAPRFDVGYAYRGLPFDLGVNVSRLSLPRGGFRVNGQDRVVDETLLNVDSSVSVSVNHPYVNQAFALTHSARIYQSELEVPEAFDPDDPITIKPDEGFLSQVRASYGLSTTEGSEGAGVGYRGVALRVAASYAGPETGSTSSYYAVEGGVTGYIPMPWPGYHSLALRFAGGASGGTYARRGNYFVGGYDLENVSFLDSVLDGTYNGAFVLRGYGPGAYSGQMYMQHTTEYRAPLFKIDWGPSTLPLFFRRLDAAAFVDLGGAFNRFQTDKIRLFKWNELIYSPDLHASVGGEAWLSFTIAHRVDFLLRAGYAYGFSSVLFPSGQPYVLAATTF
jgi:hypothetical protein